MKVLNERMLQDLKDEIIYEGVRIDVDFEGLTVSEFAEKLLIIINYKSSYNETYCITNVRTFQGSNVIEVETYNQEAAMHLLKQLVDKYEQIRITEKVKVIDLTNTNVWSQLHESDIIEMDGEFVIIGK